MSESEEYNYNAMVSESYSYFVSVISLKEYVLRYTLILFTQTGIYEECASIWAYKYYRIPCISRCVSEERLHQWNRCILPISL